MEDGTKTVAINLQPECSEKECITCPYFNYLTSYCSAADKIMDCKYCKNAFTDNRLDPSSDLSYLSIGNRDGFCAFVCSSAEYSPPVSIVVQMYQNDLNRNVDIVRYTPVYCPMCGRKIMENERFLKELHEKQNEHKKV